MMDPGGVGPGPDISYYMAALMMNKSDPVALQLAAQEVIACNPGIQAGPAAAMAQGTASRMLSVGSQETRVSLLVLKEVVRRMSGMPGQRTIILISQIGRASCRERV